MSSASFASLAASPGLLRPSPQAPAAPKGASAERISATARQFEASFVGAMLEPMFDALSTAPPFGGGAGEAGFRSFMVDAVAQQISRHGGIGLSAAVQREMLKMQGAG